MRREDQRPPISFPPPLSHHTPTLTTGTICERLSALRVCLPLPCTGLAWRTGTDVGFPTPHSLLPPSSSRLLSCSKPLIKNALPTHSPHTALPRQASLGHRGAAWLAFPPSVPGLQALATHDPLPPTSSSSPAPPAFFDGVCDPSPSPSTLLLTPHHVGLREDEHGGAGTLQFLRGEATKPSPERSGQAKGTTHHGARAILASPTTSAANQQRPRLVRGAALAATGRRCSDAAPSSRWWRRRREW